MRNIAFLRGSYKQVVAGALAGALLLAFPTPGWSTEQAQERRDSRDVKQDTRKDSRSAKVDCKLESNKSNAECRQDKRDTKQDGREQAREVKR